MGLGIYFHHTKLGFKGNADNDDNLSAFTEKVDQLAKERIGKKLRKALEPLRKIWKKPAASFETAGFL